MKKIILVCMFGIVSATTAFGGFKGTWEAFKEDWKKFAESSGIKAGYEKVKKEVREAAGDVKEAFGDIKEDMTKKVCSSSLEKKEVELKEALKKLEAKESELSKVVAAKAQCEKEVQETMTEGACSVSWAEKEEKLQEMLKKVDTLETKLKAYSVAEATQAQNGEVRLIALKKADFLKAMEYLDAIKLRLIAYQALTNAGKRGFHWNEEAFCKKLIASAEATKRFSGKHSFVIEEVEDTVDLGIGLKLDETGALISQVDSLYTFIALNFILAVHEIAEGGENVEAIEFIQESLNHWI